MLILTFKFFFKEAAHHATAGNEIQAAKGSPALIRPQRRLIIESYNDRRGIRLRRRFHFYF